MGNLLIRCIRNMMLIILAGATIMPDQSALAAQGSASRAKSNEVATFMYQANSTTVAYARYADAKLIELRTQIAARDSMISTLRRQGSSSHRNARAMARRIDQLLTEAQRDKEMFTSRLASISADYARELEILHSAGEQLVATAEGRRALELFNAGTADSWAQAKEIFDTIERVRDRKRLSDAAADRRSTAIVYYDANLRGLEPLESVIEKYQSVVEVDPTVDDWIDLASLYIRNGQMVMAMLMSESAEQTAKNGYDRLRAALSWATAAADGDDQTLTREKLDIALDILLRAEKHNPGSLELKAMTLGVYSDYIYSFVKLDEFKEAGAIVPHLEERSNIIKDSENNDQKFDFVYSRVILSDYYKGVGDLVKSTRLLEEGVLLARKIHADRRYPMDNALLANALDKLGRQICKREPQRANLLLTEALAIREKVLSLDDGSATMHSEKLASLIHIAECRRDAAAWDRVVRQSVLMDSRKILRDDDKRAIEKARKGIVYGLPQAIW